MPCKVMKQNLDHGTFLSFTKLCQKGQLVEAFQFIDLLYRQRFPISTNVFYPLLQGCINNKDLQAGKEVHGMIMNCGLDSNVFLGSHLIRMFALCGSLLDAKSVFSRLPTPDVFTWGAIITAHAKLRQPEQAIELYHLMCHQSQVKPDSHIFVAVLKACSSTTASDEGKLIHAHAIESNLDCVLHVGNTLIDMYAKWGSTKDAYKIFDRLLERDLVTWNTIIAGYFQHGEDERAFQLFLKMQEEGIEPDHVTFICIMKVCCGISTPHEGKLACQYTFDTDFEINFLDNNVNDRCANSLSLEDARKLFNKLSNRSLATWSAMITGYAEHGCGDEALKLFKQMQQEGFQPDCVTFVCVLKACSSVSALDQGKLIHAHAIESFCELDLFVGNSLINMYGKCGSLQDARILFDKLPHRSLVTWSAIIAGYAQHGHGQDALQLFEQMQQEGMKPNQVTYFCILKACSSMAALDQGKLIHAYVIETGFQSDLCVGNTLIDMYAKCGSLQDAYRMFAGMSNRSVVTWSAMIAAYAQHHNYDLALQCFEDMQAEGLKPNDVTFICLLSVCCHLGLVEEGCRHFHSMEDEYGVIPTCEHHNSMVDLLGRAGCLKEAAHLLEGIPDGPNVVAWVSLLSQCRIHGNLQLAKRCFENIVALDSGDASAYVLMSSIYAEAGLWEDADKVQELRKCANVSKKLGKAFVEADNKVHQFVVGDRSHPQSSDIYAWLKRFDMQVKGKGYVPQLDLVPQPL